MSFFRESTFKHQAPVWKVNWVVKEVSLTEGGYSECLVSIAMDGNVLQWSIQKGFESSQIMQLKRMDSKKEKKAKAKTTQQRGAKKANQLAKNARTKQEPPKPDIGIGQTYITQHAPGMGLAFSPKEPNMQVFFFLIPLCILFGIN